MNLSKLSYARNSVLEHRLDPQLFAIITKLSPPMADIARGSKTEDYAGYDAFAANHTIGVWLRVREQLSWPDEVTIRVSERERLTKTTLPVRWLYAFVENDKVIGWHFLDPRKISNWGKLLHNGEEDGHGFYAVSVSANRDAVIHTNPPKPKAETTNLSVLRRFLATRAAA